MMDTFRPCTHALAEGTVPQDHMVDDKHQRSNPQYEGT